MPKKKYDIESNFGIDVFDDKSMKEFLSGSAYAALKKTIEDNKALDPSLADDVASGMMKWALSKGATHYTHWFQPLNGLTAEKHDSFISAPDKKGNVIMEFSGKNLIKGEPDASSFPSGGLRATFEARGYTAWDCTSPAFVIHDEYGSVLYIPTAFCSYTGEALDEKTPLLRSMDFLSDQAVRALRALGNTTTTRVGTCEGPEQEYFIVEAPAYEKRKDLVYTGRTLFGATAPKGQEMEDHYFGPIREKIISFMQEVNETLWSLGVASKTEHNEVAPSQHELASIFAPTNLAADQNQLVMLTLKKVAKKHGFICLLGEKPFAGINGSGKHNNWSINTDDGINLFRPGKNPKDNIQFLVFLTAVIKGLDEYSGLLRESVATYGNDFRLGANEAPPAIISIFLGDELQDLVESIVHPDKASHEKASLLLSTGAKSLPTLSKDNTDRNRTSPFAYTGNRFEFRMVGSEQNIAEPNVALNTIAGIELKNFADYVDSQEDKDKAIHSWIKDNLTKHERIIFNGDGYSEAWVKEAEKRGLPNLKTTVEATDVLLDEKVIRLFEESQVLSPVEVKSRANIKYTNYANQVIIDAKTMSHMAHKLYIPAVNKFLGQLAEEISSLKQAELFIPKATVKLAKGVSKLIEETGNAADKLDSLISEAKTCSGRDLAVFCRDELIPAMKGLRDPIDALELLVSKDVWPVPSYGDLLFHTF
ncbi:MAG: glutamine synthetase III [Bacilli bacterium]